MHHIEKLMHIHTARESNRKHSLVLTVVTPKFASTSNCPVPKYTYCELTLAKKHSHQVYDSKPQTNAKQVTLSQQINLLSLLLVDGQQVIEVKVMTIIFMVEPSSMMQHLVQSGLKIKFLLVLMKLSWQRLAFKSGFRIQFVLKASTFIVTMVSLLLMSFMQIALRNINLRVFQKLVLINKMPMLSNVTCFTSLILIWC